MMSYVPFQMVLQLTNRNLWIKVIHVPSFQQCKIEHNFELAA